MFKELRVNIISQVTVFIHSKTAMQIAANPIFYEWKKHIEIDCHFIRDKIKTEMVKIIYVHTKVQISDLLPKGLGHVHYVHLLTKSGVLNILHPPY